MWKFIFLPLLFINVFVTSIVLASPLDLGNLTTIAEDTINIKLQIKSNKSIDSVTWKLSKTHIPIFFRWLEERMSAVKTNEEFALEDISKDYQGVIAIIEDKYGKIYDPLIIYNRHINNKNGKHLLYDPNREFEYWLLGSSDIFEHQSLVSNIVPIISFAQCTALGNQVVSTSPRQCLLPNGDIFLEVTEKPTQESLSITNFKECLAKGIGIINIFPRRCIATGGHVFAEPYQVKDTPMPAKSSNIFKIK